MLENTVKTYSLKRISMFIAQTVFAGLGIAFFLAYWKPTFEKLPETVFALPWIIQAVASLALIWGLWKLAFRQLPVRLSHLNYVLQVPPKWIALMLGCAFASILDACGHLGSSEGRPSAWQVFTIGIVAAAIELWKSASTTTAHGKNIEQRRSNSKSTEIEWNVIECWLLAESPSQFDLFDHSTVAERLAYHVQTSSPTCKSLGLVGEFGSGKSTIVRWMEDCLKGNEHPKTIVNVVNCWGFHDSSKAVEEILSAIIDALHQEVDCSSFNRLPEDFRQAVATGVDWLSPFVDMFVKDSNPREQLKVLAELLSELSLRVLIVVEDLDRNKSSSFDVSDVLAVLAELHELPSITYLITGGQDTSSSIDYARLCDQIESIPLMDEDLAANILKTVRNHCLNEYPDIRVKRKGNSTDNITWEKIRHETLVHLALGLKDSPIANAALDLARTPRILKHALRKTLSIWWQLHGEIDFDDLLFSCILRFGAAPAFNFVLLHADELRIHDGPFLNSSLDKERDEKLSARLKEEWSKAVQSQELINPSAALTVIGFLFPNSQKWLGDEKNCPSTARSGADQCVRNESPVDYWRRLLAEQLTDGEVSDQEILRAIKSWVEKRDPQNELVRRAVYEREFETRVVRFLNMIPTEAVLALCDQIVDTFVEKHGSTFRLLEDHGDSVLTTLMYEREISGVDWLKGKIGQILPKSLNIVNFFYNSLRNSANRFICREEWNEVRLEILEASKRTFCDADSVLSSLSPETSYSLRHLVFADVANGFVEATYVSTADWQWLAPFLLDALRKDRVCMAPQVARLVFRIEERGIGDLMVNVDDEKLKGLFGESSPEVIKLLLQYPELKYPHEIRFRPKALECCQEWLKKQKSDDAAGTRPAISGSD